MGYRAKGAHQDGVQGMRRSMSGWGAGHEDEEEHIRMGCRA